jgi:hypothetical protein
MAKKIESDAPAAETPLTPVDRAVAPRPRRSGLFVGGIVAGGVLAAGLLFGGGVLLGANLPHGGPAQPGQPGVAQGQFPGGPGGGAGMRGGGQGGPRFGGQQPPTQDGSTGP